MDFSYIEEQQLLADTVNRLIEKEYDFEKRKAHVATVEGFSRPTWNTFTMAARSPSIWRGRRLLAVISLTMGSL